MRYISLTEAVAIHAAIMDLTGSSPAPLRDEGLLESAVLRARMVAEYERADLVRQCAFLAVGVSQAQAFLDGNKRTAFAVADLFLRRNGVMYSGEPVEMARQMEAVAERDDDLGSATDRFEAWLRDHVSPLDASP